MPRDDCDGGGGGGSGKRLRNSSRRQALFILRLLEEERGGKMLPAYIHTHRGERNGERERIETEMMAPTDIFFYLQCRIRGQTKHKAEKAADGGGEKRNPA